MLRPFLVVPYGLHFHQLERRHRIVFDHQPGRRRQEVENDAFMMRGNDFTLCRHIFFGPTVDEMHVFSAHAPYRPYAIHGHVATANDHHITRHVERFAPLDALVHLAQKIDAGDVTVKAGVFILDTEPGSWLAP